MIATRRALGWRITPGIADARHAHVNSQSRYTGTTTTTAADWVAAFRAAGEVKSVSVTIGDVPSLKIQAHSAQTHDRAHASPVIGRGHVCRNNGSETRCVGMSGNDSTVGSSGAAAGKTIRAHDTIAFASRIAKEKSLIIGNPRMQQSATSRAHDRDPTPIYNAAHASGSPGSEFAEMPKDYLGTPARWVADMVVISGVADTARWLQQTISRMRRESLTRITPIRCDVVEARPLPRHPPRRRCRNDVDSFRAHRN